MQVKIFYFLWLVVDGNTAIISQCYNHSIFIILFNKLYFGITLVLPKSCRDSPELLYSLQPASLNAKYHSAFVKTKKLIVVHNY